jgi:hypothetical protein
MNVIELNLESPEIVDRRRDDFHFGVPQIRVAMTP